MNSDEKRVFVITGTSRGIGEEIARYYLAKRHFVIGCSRGKQNISDKRYYHYELDVADEKKVSHMIKSVKKKFDHIDVLINNAGIASMNHILFTPAGTVESIFSTNFLGTFLFTREVSKIMIHHKRGRIINLTSIATPLRLEGEAIYSASKAAINNFTKIAAKELSEFGITVNAVGPTPVPTDLIKNVPKNKINALLNMQPIKRFGNYMDIVNVIDFFLDDKSHFITGQIIYLGGVSD